MGQLKKGLCIGINYQGTEYELRGCINDADDWASLLNKQKFDVSLLAEKQATKANIVLAAKNLVASLKAGDVGVITYSGHGTWVPDVDGDEPDGRDEAICPIDMGDDGHNLILDDELHLLLNGIAKGAHLVLITDSCHSGTVYRFFNGAAGDRKVRFIPPSHFIKDKDLLHRHDRAFGQRVQRTDAPLPGLIHFSGCRDTEYSNDATIDGRPCGAMSYFATRAFYTVLKSKGTYFDAWNQLRRSLPSWEFQQTPLLNATPDLKKAKLLS